MSDSDSIKDALDALLGKHADFAVRVSQLSHSWTDAPARVRAKFFYLTFRDGLPTLSEFVQYLKRELVAFCIPRSERVRVYEQIKANKDNLYLAQEIFEKARSLFIKAHEECNREGEAGELILYVLLEWALNAPQVVSKMYLKTSAQMPVHGSDGIHLGIDADTEQLTIYLGESKLYQTLQAACNAALISVKEMASTEEKMKREVDILRDHIDLGDLDNNLKEKILSYLNPYKKDYLNTRTAFACFLGANFAHYNELKGVKPQDVEAAFSDAFTKHIDSFKAELLAQMSEKGLDHLNFEFLLLPFPSVKEFRKAFYNAIGWIK